MADLQRRGAPSPYSRRSQRVNLSQSKIVRIPLIRFGKIAIWTMVFSYLVFGSVLAPIDSGQHSLAAQNEEERQQLEKQLSELESQIDQYQGTIDQYRSEGKNLEGEIAQLNAKVSKLNLQIKAITITLKNLDSEIEVNQGNISLTQSEINKNKTVLTRALQSIYENGNLSMTEILLTNPSLAVFFDNINNLMGIQESLRGTLERTMELRDNLVDAKEQLAIKKSDVAALRSYQLSQKITIDQTKKEKNSVLQVTKGQESKYQDLLKKTQKTAAQIRSRLFELLGGGELTFDEAYKFAKFASDAVGVRPALILAVLDRESALGQNVGRCTYQKAMHPTRDIPVFLALLGTLGINPDSIMVSCANQDGVYGGAMGPAQFIPSTWEIYKNKVASITGSNPASPWRNGDAFVATGLYLKDAYNSSSCVNYANENSHISSKQLLRERCAAAKYYAGGRWYTYRWAYGQPVVDRADSFQKDIDILNS